MTGGEREREREEREREEREREREKEGGGGSDGAGCDQPTSFALGRNQLRVKERDMI